MYNRFYSFLEKSKLVFLPQFDFRQKNSTTHALIHLLDKVKKETGKANYTCGILVDFQNTFDIIDLHILLKN